MRYLKAKRSHDEQGPSKPLQTPAHQPAVGEVGPETVSRTGSLKSLRSLMDMVQVVREILHKGEIICKTQEHIGALD